MSEKEIENIALVSKAEKWPYPKTFHFLKEAGVVSYNVAVSTHQVTYFHGDQSYQEKVPDDFQILQIEKKYNEALLKQALRNVQSGKTNYEEFLEEIAEAGIHNYNVEMSTNRISYCGVNPEEKYEEKIPVYTAS